MMVGGEEEAAAAAVVVAAAAAAAGEEEEEEEEEEERVDARRVVGHEGEDVEVSFVTRDLLVYAVGIGLGAHARDLRFCYEEHEAFAVFPTFLMCLPFKGTSHDVVPFPSPTLASFPPGLPVVNPALILHAEQSLRLVQPLQVSEQRLMARTRVVSLEDKRKGALLRTQTTFRNETGQVVAQTVGGTFIRGLTGFESVNTDPSAMPRVSVPTDRPADHVVALCTTPTQALVFRLSGDYNPLHADPNIAQSVGFQRPILHGLCGMGFAARALQAVCDPARRNPCDPGTGDEEAEEEDEDATAGPILRYIQARFSKPVIPGQTLETHFWRDGAPRGGVHRLFFRTVVQETGAVVLDAGLAEVGEPAAQAKL